MDYVSCVVELLNSGNLTHFARARGFLFLFFVSITLINVNVSSVLYLAN